MGLPNRKCVFQPSIFRGYVSFREGRIQKWWCLDIQSYLLQFGVCLVCVWGPNTEPQEVAFGCLGIDWEFKIACIYLKTQKQYFPLPHVFFGFYDNTTVLTSGNKTQFRVDLKKTSWVCKWFSGMRRYASGLKENTIPHHTTEKKPIFVCLFFFKILNPFAP